MVQLTISFEEAFHGLTKDISFSRLVQAEGVKSENCLQCDGRGVVMQQARTPFGVMQTQAACPQCGGTGQQYFKDGQKVANGGLEKQPLDLEVKIPAAIKS